MKAINLVIKQHDIVAVYGDKYITTTDQHISEVKTERQLLYYAKVLQADPEQDMLIVDNGKTRAVCSYDDCMLCIAAGKSNIAQANHSEFIDPLLKILNDE